MLATLKGRVLRSNGLITTCISSIIILILASTFLGANYVSASTQSAVTTNKNLYLAGYQIASPSPGAVALVRGRVTIPSLLCHKKPGDLAQYFIGIINGNGENSIGDGMAIELGCDGTNATSPSFNLQYSHDGVETHIPESVHAGDVIESQTRVNYTDHNFTLAVSDVTRGWTNTRS